MALTDVAIRNAKPGTKAIKLAEVMGLIVRAIGIVPARIKISMTNLAYNFQRFEGRTAPV